MDIVDLARYQHFNKRYEYLLVVVDALSRKAHAEPMINKNGSSVREAFIK